MIATISVYWGAAIIGGIIVFLICIIGGDF